MLFETNTTKPSNFERHTAAKPIQQKSRVAGLQGYNTGANKPLAPTNTNVVQPPTNTITSATQPKQAVAGRGRNSQLPPTKSQPTTTYKPEQPQKSFLGFSTSKHQQQRPTKTNAVKLPTTSTTFATPPGQALAGRGGNYQQQLKKLQPTPINKPGQRQKSFLGLSTSKQQPKRSIGWNSNQKSFKNQKLSSAPGAHGQKHAKGLPFKSYQDVRGWGSFRKAAQRQPGENSTAQTEPHITQATSLSHKPLRGWGKYRKSNGKSLNTSTASFEPARKRFSNAGVRKQDSKLVRGWSKYYHDSMNPSMDVQLANTSAQSAYTNSNNISPAGIRRRGWSYFRNTAIPPQPSSTSFATDRADTPAISVQDACRICGCAINECGHQ